jgi:hypothetical protein
VNHLGYRYHNVSRRFALALCFSPAQGGGHLFSITKDLLLNTIHNRMIGSFGNSVEMQVLLAQSAVSDGMIVNKLSSSQEMCLLNVLLE